jgi:N-carbamoyl-L-amino-acid hydrolase
MHAAVAQACEDLGLPVRRMPSRASHDAARLAPVAPAGMVFIRCKDGKSHAFEEWADLDDIAAAHVHMEGNANVGKIALDVRSG